MTKYLFVAILSLAALASWLAGPAPDGVTLACPAAAIAIPAIASVVGGFLSSRGQKQTTRQAQPYPLSSFLPPELLSIFDPNYHGTSNADTPLGKAIAAMLSQASQGLPADVKQRGLANIASGFQGALDASNRNAAFGFGPALLSPAIAEAGRGRAAANFGADFESMSQQQRLAALLPLLNFFTQIQGIRFGTPTGSSTTVPGPGALSGALSGAGAGLSAYNAYAGSGTNTYPSFMQPGAATPQQFNVYKTDF